VIALRVLSFSVQERHCLPDSEDSRRFWEPRLANQPQPKGQIQMTNQDAAGVAHGWLDAFNSSDWEKAKAHLSSDSVYEEYGTQRHLEGSEAIIQLYQAWKTAMPDVKGKLANTYTSGNKVALELTWEGTHTGPLVTPGGTIPASGKHQETRAAMVFTFQGDRIKESHQYFDLMTLLRQIGALPQ